MKKKTRKQEQEAKAREKVARNREITPGSRRKSKTSEWTDRFIVQQSSIGNLYKKHLADALNAQNAVKFSTSSIQKRLGENGIHWRRKARKSFVSEKNRLGRFS